MTKKKKTNDVIGDFLDVQPDNVLINYITLRIFLHLKTINGSDVGIRETQRNLRIKSPSTVSTHLERLMNAGFVEKLSNNRYTLTEAGRSIRDFEVPMMVSVRFFQGRLIPKMSFILGFHGLMAFFVFLVWITGNSHTLIALASSMTLAITLGLIFREWLAFRTELKSQYNQPFDV